MNTIHPQYITDDDGKKTAVILSMAEFEQILEELDEFNDIKLYDEVTKDYRTPMVLDDYVKQRFLK